MPILSWTSAYTVYVDELDQDHRDIFSAFNTLWQAAADRAARKALQEALAVAYVTMDEHFKREEAILWRSGYPNSQKHADEHQKLLEKLNRIRTKVCHSQSPEVELKTIEFIGEWLSSHILESDKKYARFLQAEGRLKSKGASPMSQSNKNSLQEMSDTKSRQVIFVASLGVLLSVFLFWIVLRIERAVDEARFHELADQHIIAVKSNIDLAVDSISYVVGHFAITNPKQTTRAGFGHLVGPVLERHPYIQGFSWDPRITREDRSEFERLAKIEGPADFRIFERNMQGKPVAALDRDDYIPIFYMEPFDKNRGAIGFDLASNPARNEALKLAKTIGQPVATARITLVQETANQYGVLLLAPVFDKSELRGETGRPDVLLGYVSGVFRIGTLIDESRAALSPVSSAVKTSIVNVHVFDLTAPANSQQLYPSTNEGSPETLRIGLHEAVSFDIGQRKWQIIITPNDEFRGSLRYNAVLALASGLAITLLFTLNLKSNFERTKSLAVFAREIGRAKQRQTEAQKIARLGFLEFDSKTGQWSLGEGAAELLEISGGRSSGTAEEIFTNVNADDFRRLFAHIQSHGVASLSVDVQVGERIVQIFGQDRPDENVGNASVVTVQDVTQRRSAERERAALIERVSDASRLESLGTLAGGIAHEINTPAQYVGDNLHFIKDNLPPLLNVVGGVLDAEKSGQWAAVIETAKSTNYEFVADELPAATEGALAGIKQISKVVQAVKDFSHPRTNDPQPFDLNRAVEVACTVTHNQWKYVAELRLDLANDLPPLRAIEGEVNQIMVNLIVNAAQAIEASGRGAPGLIVVKTQSQGTFIELSVADNGSGISKKITNKIFDMFFTTKPPGMGTGQGLAIVKAIVQRHRGSISVSSEPGEGARFSVLLPIDDSASAP